MDNKNNSLEKTNEILKNYKSIIEENTIEIVKLIGKVESLEEKVDLMVLNQTDNYIEKVKQKQLIESLCVKIANLNDRINNLSVLQDFMKVAGEEDSVENKLKRINDTTFIERG